MPMAEETNQARTSTSSIETVDFKNQSKSQIVSLPKICLTRIDEKNLLETKPTFSKVSPLRKGVKMLRGKNLKTQKPSRTSLNKKSGENTEKRPRGRPKKEISAKLLLKPRKKGLEKAEVKTKSSVSTSSIKSRVKSQNRSGVALKKSLLQKKSKVTIPTSKKSNQKIDKKPEIKKKQTPKIIIQQKKNPPKPKLNVLHNKQESSDSSENEFLYDELIEELQTNSSNRFKVKSSLPEKKTNITLKPNVGDKPPIVVKGGIVKKTDLPSNLKSIASPKTPYPKKINNGEQASKHLSLSTSGRKNKISFDNTDNLIPAKKPSPWPAATDSPTKVALENVSKIKSKTNSQVEVNSNSVNSKTSEIPKNSGVLSLDESVTSKLSSKKTAKVIPISKPIEPDGNTSDEYLEEETLECDYEQANPSNSKNIGNGCSLTTTDPKGDDDPNIDLLRILTDDSDDLMPLQPSSTKELVVNHSFTGKSESIEKLVKEDISSFETSHIVTEGETTNQIKEQPQVRTIYDLMNEVSLQYPSWNLHIIPETSAFCIAQVTKGRLGLPTLKKCIELDPVHYNAKVYIHQYHIKRFDGVYDSEESILALIQEINNIKA